MENKPKIQEEIKLQPIENRKKEKKWLKKSNQLAKTTYVKVKDAILQQGEYKKEVNRLNRSKKDLEREIVRGYFVVYMGLLGISMLIGPNHENIFTYISSLITTFIGTSMFFGFMGTIAFVFIREYVENQARIYDEFEIRKEKIETITKTDGRPYVVVTEKGRYTVDLSGGGVIVKER